MPLITEEKERSQHFKEKKKKSTQPLVNTLEEEGKKKKNLWAVGKVKFHNLVGDNRG